MPSTRRISAAAPMIWDPFRPSTTDGSSHLKATEEIHLVLTPQASELTDSAKQAFIDLFDAALTNFVGLSQSLSRHESNELDVGNVTISVDNQMVESVFVLGAAGASAQLLDRGGASTRNLLQRLLLRRGSSLDEAMLPAVEQPMRSLAGLSGASSGVIVSSLDLHLSVLAALTEYEHDKEDTAMHPPDLRAYILDFFSPGSQTSNNFIEAARHLMDEFGVVPLSDLRYIGVGKSELWENPYSFLEGDMPQNTVAEARGQEAAGGVEEASLSTKGSSVDWMKLGLTAGGACVVLAVVVGLLVWLMLSKQRKKKDGRRHENDSTQQVPQEVLNYNFALPTSPVTCFVKDDESVEVISLNWQQQRQKKQRQKQQRQKQRLQQCHLDTL